MANQPDTLQTMTDSWMVNVDNPIDTKRLFWISFYPSKNSKIALDVRSL